MAVDSQLRRRLMNEDHRRVHLAYHHLMHHQVMAQAALQLLHLARRVNVVHRSLQVKLCQADRHSLPAAVVIMHKQVHQIPL